MREVVINYVLTKWVFVSLTDEKTGKKADDRLECAEKEKLFKCLFLCWLVDHLTTEVDGTATPRAAQSFQYLERAPDPLNLPLFTLSFYPPNEKEEKTLPTVLLQFPEE